MIKKRSLPRISIDQQLTQAGKLKQNFVQKIVLSGEMLKSSS
jgi:hypothetical protein